MTQKRVKQQAIEIAAAFYDYNERTPGFRKTYPTLKAYLRGQQHMPNGEIIIDKPGWWYHIKDARALMATQLRNPSISTYEKDEIAKALIADHNEAINSKVKVPQRTNREPLH